MKSPSNPWPSNPPRNRGVFFRLEFLGSSYPWPHVTHWYSFNPFWDLFPRCGPHRGFTLCQNLSYKEVVVCFIFKSRDNLLAVCFLCCFISYEAIQDTTDNCSLDAGRIDAEGIPLRSAQTHHVDTSSYHMKCQLRIRQCCLWFYSIMQESSVTTE